MKRFFARTTPWHTVQTGELFRGLSPMEQRAVIAHERGHLRHWHAEKRLIWVLTGRALFDWPGFLAMCERQELEADQHAVDRGHAAGLRVFLIRNGRAGRALGYPCLSKRLEALDG